MILAFDVGNSETTIGLCNGLKVKERWRVTTDASRTPDEVFCSCWPCSIRPASNGRR